MKLWPQRKNRGEYLVKVIDNAYEFGVTNIPFSTHDAAMTKQVLTTYCSFLDKAKKCLRNRSCGGETSLSRACCNSRLRVCRLTGDRRLCARMAHLGLVPGRELQLICSGSGENCLVKLGDGVLTLDEQTSENIIVTAI